MGGFATRAFKLTARVWIPGSRFTRPGMTLDFVSPRSQSAEFAIAAVSVVRQFDGACVLVRRKCRFRAMPRPYHASTQIRWCAVVAEDGEKCGGEIVERSVDHNPPRVQIGFAACGIGIVEALDIRERDRKTWQKGAL